MSPRSFTSHPRVRVLLAAVIVGLLIAAGALWYVRSHFEITQEEADQFNSHVNEEALDFYKGLCAAHNTVTDASRDLADVPQESQLGESPKDVSLRIMEAMATQSRGVDKAVGIIESTPAPESVEYLGDKDDVNFVPIRDTAAADMRKSQEPLGQARADYESVDTADQLAKAQVASKKDMDAFSDQVSQSISAAFSAAEIPTQATQDALDKDPECAELFNRVQWSASPANKKVDKVALSVVDKLSASRSTVMEGLAPITQLPAAKGDVTVDDARQQLIDAVTPLSESLHTAKQDLDTYKAPALYYPQTKEKKSVRPVIGRVQAMLNHQTEAVDEALAQLGNVSTADELTAAQDHLESVLQTLNRDIFTTYKEASQKLEFPTDATRTAASESDSCNQWCTF